MRRRKMARSEMICARWSLLQHRRRAGGNASALCQPAAASHPATCCCRANQRCCALASRCNCHPLPQLLSAPELQRLGDGGPAGAVFGRDAAAPVVQRGRNQLLHTIGEQGGQSASACSHQHEGAAGHIGHHRSHQTGRYRKQGLFNTQPQHAPACWWGAAPRCACTAGPRCPALGTAPASPPGAAHRWCRGSPQSAGGGQAEGGAARLNTSTHGRQQMAVAATQSRANTGKIMLARTQPHTPTASSAHQRCCCSPAPGCCPARAPSPSTAQSPPRRACP